MGGRLFGSHLLGWTNGSIVNPIEREGMSLNFTRVPQRRNGGRDKTTNLIGYQKNSTNEGNDQINNTKSKQDSQSNKKYR